MTTKQVLYFIAKCLSLSQYPERKKEVLQQITLNAVDWEQVVRVGSGQMVLPALYLNLKSAALLYALPDDLVAYLDEITQLNRARNEALIKQSKALNTVLLQYQVQPIFLKGTAHLLEGLYEDIAERMVGDIDFIVAPDQVAPTVKLLLEMGYVPIRNLEDYDALNAKHYPRLVHENWIAAVEVHQAVITPKYQYPLNYEIIVKQCQLIGEVLVPSFTHQALHNCLNTQLNDAGYWYGKIVLRQLYDAYLLSFKSEVPHSLHQTAPYRQLKLVYVALVKQLFKADHLHLKTAIRTQLAMFRYVLSLSWPKQNYYLNKVVHVYRRLLYLMRKIIQAFFTKAQRKRIVRIVKTPSKYKEHWGYFKY